MRHRAPARPRPARALCGVLLASLAVVPACDDGDVDPVSGEWDFDSREILANDCNYDDIRISEGLFLVDNRGDGTITIDPQDGSDLFDCALDGSEFDCPARLDSETAVGTATIVVHVGADGTFTSSTAAEGEQHAHVTCEGEGCDTLASTLGVTLPCDIDASFVADAR